MEIVELSTSLHIADIVRAAFPDYRKRKAYVSNFPESGMEVNSYWDGGSRDEYAIVHIQTLSRKPLPTSHPHFDLKGVTGQVEDLFKAENGRVTMLRLPEGFALVRAGTFIGKPATAHVYFTKQLTIT